MKAAKQKKTTESLQNKESEEKQEDPVFNVTGEHIHTDVLSLNVLFCSDRGCEEVRVHVPRTHPVNDAGRVNVLQGENEDTVVNSSGDGGSLDCRSICEHWTTFRPFSI